MGIQENNKPMKIYVIKIQNIPYHPTFFTIYVFPMMRDAFISAYILDFIIFEQAFSYKLVGLNQFILFILLRKCEFSISVLITYIFKTADEPIRKALYEKKVAPPGKLPNFMYIEEGVRRMRQGLFAFHMETGSGYKIVGTLPHQ